MEKEPKSRKKKEIQNPTAFKALYSVDRASAMGHVASEMNVPFERLKEAGEKVSDHVVPKNMVYISLDAGVKTVEFWQKVDVIAPPPTADDIKSGRYPK